MILDTCPRCRNESLRITNVITKTQILHRKCSKCGYSDRVQYEKGGYFANKLAGFHKPKRGVKK